LFSRAAAAEPDRHRGLAMAVEPVAMRFVNRQTRGYLWIMFATGSLVLLLACANVANLQLVQTVSRQRELAVRVALGAGRRRLLMNVLAESLVLSTFASLLALWLAQLGGRWLTWVFEQVRRALQLLDRSARRFPNVRLRGARRACDCVGGGRDAGAARGPGRDRGATARRRPGADRAGRSRVSRAGW
jgi:hypothetical protein